MVDVPGNDYSLSRLEFVMKNLLSTLLHANARYDRALLGRCKPSTPLELAYAAHVTVSSQLAGRNSQVIH